MDTLKEKVTFNKLYHFTDAKKAYNIIKEDTLRVGGNYVFNQNTGQCICLSRSFNFIKSRINKASVVFVINKDLLKQNYKVIPISDTKNMTNKRARFDTDSKAEELVFKDITNFHKYIDKILVTDEVYDIYKKVLPDIEFIKISDYKLNEDVNMDNKKLALQILYWLEDKGLTVDYSDWGDIAYYTFEDNRDYQNAIHLLSAYCGKKAIIDTDNNRLEIRVDIPSTWTKLKESLDEDTFNNDDIITENLLESDLVEDDLEDIIRDTINDMTDNDSSIRLFEVDSDDEDSKKLWIVDFDDEKTDFRKLTIYPHQEDENGANKPVASFMLSGGLNGSGNWTDYLDDLQKLLEVLKERTGLEPVIYEESTDIADDVWDAKVFMYDHNDEDDFPLDEGLFNPQSNEDIIDDMIKYYDDYMQHDRSLESILDKVLTKNNYNIEDYDTIDQVPRDVWLDFYKDTKDYYQKEVDKYGDAAEIPTEAFDVFNLNSFDPEEHINEDLFHPNKLSYTFKVGDTITTPQNYDELLGGALSENCYYRIIKTRDGKYDIWYKDLETYSNPNISGGEGTFAEFDGSTFDSLEELSQTLLQLEPNLTMEMINRPNPRRSYSLTIEHNPELEKLLNFWNTNNIANYKVNWLNSNRIRTVDVYGDKTPEIWQVNPNKSLKLINSLNNQVVKEWSSVEEYISEFEEDNRDLDDEDLNEDVIEETYSKDELNSFKNKVFNQRKIMSIYKKKKYGKNRLMCRTKCVNCGREKKLFLSNLVTNPEKYGSCICSDKNIDSRYDTINGLYKGTKKLRSNTSGYTGVSWVATYGGEPYNKWRAYIDIDGHRNYLGDFSSKSKAIRARKAAAAKGIKWYSENKDQFMATSRRKRKRHRTYKNKKSTANS